MKQHSATVCRRGAFTLLELLVVIAILMVLFALTTAAAMRYLDVQRRKNTEQTLAKLDTAIRAHIKAVHDQANKEAIPPLIVQRVAAINPASPDVADNQRARVIWLKLREKQEFPTNFQEALAPAPGVLQAKPEYQTLLQGAGGIGANYHSAVCLYLILKQNRGGTDFNIDVAMTSRELQETGVPGLKYVTDDWGQPLAFYRWPTGYDEMNPGGAPPINPTNNTRLNDPTDPQCLLANSRWVSSQGGMIFQQLCHQVFPQMTFRLEPVIVSPGPNGLLGLQPGTMQMIDPTANDNLNSYRYRLSGRGD